MSEQAIQNVPDTAFLVATYRANESERRDALFVDPFAKLLAGEHGKKILSRLTRGAAVGAWSVVVRTVIIDELIDRAIENGADTIVNLGAGLDARPYRMALPESLRWIEVDYPEMIELKEQRLAEATLTCKIERVKMDLADVEARRKLLADVDASSKNILVLTEGVIPYLTVDQVGALADDLRKMGHLRSWIVDYFSKETLRCRRRASRDFVNAPFKFDPENWLDFFAKHGWRPKEERYLVEEGKRLGRAIPLPFLMKATARFLTLFSKKGTKSMRRFAGYFVMVPTA